MRCSKAMAMRTRRQMPAGVRESAMSMQHTNLHIGVTMPLRGKRMRMR